MKKFLLSVACCMIGISASAQKTETTYQFTQARMPQVWVEPLVKPLVVEVEVIKDAPKRWKRNLPRYKVETELKGDMENIYNYGIFLYTEETNADMIVAATYNFYTNPDRKNNEDEWYTLEIKGVPAVFKEWRPATPEDYEWMRIYTSKTTNKGVFEKVSEK